MPYHKLLVGEDIHSLQRWEFSGEAARLGITSSAGVFEEKTSSFVAEYGGNYTLMNTVGITVTLPANVEKKQSIVITGGVSAETNNITVARNGNTIGGEATDMTIDNKFYQIEFVPLVSTSDWRVGGSLS